MASSKLTSWIPPIAAFIVNGLAVLSYFAVGLLLLAGRMGVDGFSIVLPPLPPASDASAALVFLVAGVLAAHEFVRLNDALRLKRRIVFSGKYYLSMGVLLHSASVAVFLSYVLAAWFPINSILNLLFFGLMPVYGLLTLWIYEQVDPEEA